MLLLLLSSPMLHGEDDEYAVVWYTIDGGGGTSTGGEYSLSGTIGQADADWGRGGAYEVLGGYWPGGPLCIVEFDDFARFAEYWWLSDADADLNDDPEINFKDLGWFTDYWLSYCPYAWPLR